ncbi:hypothetical protein KR222_003114 [Zaprionus bogoriensis]|nr:hypothetical protein KR222_003114 [Zaprionus bogoriensis]
MGNCLKIRASDDISLLRGGDIINGQESGSLPTYQASVVIFLFIIYNINFHCAHQEPHLYYPTSSSVSFAGHESATINQMSEEGQIRIAKRIGLVQHLPIGTYDVNSKKARECVICMVEFCVDEAVRYLPCMHIYHVHCIDDWLMRSLTCPSCLEPVDAALLTSYDTA